MNWYRIAKEILDPKWKKVDSSFITHVAYDDINGIIDVRMKNHDRGYAEFSYKIPKHIYNSFLKASSKGEFFNKVIRKRKLISR